MTAAKTEARSNWLGGRYAALVVGLWIGVVLGYVYVRTVSQPNLERRIELLESVVQGQEKSDYLYATFLVARLQQLVIDGGVLTANHCLALTDFAGLVFLFVCAGWFVAELSPGLSSRLGGLLWLAVTAPLLFQHHYYHPSDFYATGLTFLILLAIRDGRFMRVAALCLLSGMLWEKALFVPLVYFLWQAGRMFIGTAAVRALPAALAVAYCFFFWRFAFPDAPRVYAYGTWSEFVPSLVPAALEWVVWIGPIAAILGDLLRRREKLDAFWWCWLLYVPLLLGVLIYVRGHLIELRSFWILQPIFVGVIVSWLDRRTALA